MLNFNPHIYRYPSRRNMVFSGRGMVATSQPLAAQAGLSVLQKGGNAIDAAVATAAALTVLEPTSNGIGSDAFALIWHDGQLYGLNSSGPAPALFSAEQLKKRGHSEVPKFGWPAVTVPGAPAAWSELAKRFGKLPLADSLAPAVGYGHEGYPLSPTLAWYWHRAFNIYKRELAAQPQLGHWFKTFAPAGEPPTAGTIWRSPAHAETLRLIGDSDAEQFYRGELAERLDKFARETDFSFIRKSDLETYQPQWVEPIKIDYRGYDVWEIPPNGQGIIALMALNIVKNFDFSHKECAQTYHRQIEALKLAFIDGKEFIAEPDSMRVTIEELLSDRYAAKRAALISDTATEPAAGKPGGSGTVYLATADDQGNMVSFIQSNYMGFGSGLVVPDCGIALQNRGCNFSLDADSANYAEAGKRPYHTIIPGFLSCKGQAVGPFGVMGGFMQPQGHLQVISNTIDFAMNPQEALDAPRWQWHEGNRIYTEPCFDNAILKQLRDMGHDIIPQVDGGGMGRGQIIWRMANGVMAGGSEPRTDGHIALW